MGDSPVMELLNLILTGEASSNLFDGTKLLRFQDNQSKLLKGINQKTSIGFISILEDISLIGNHLKYPDSNIFVVHELNHYSVTFSLDKESKRIKSMIYIDPFSNSGEIVLNLGEKNVLNGTDFVSCRGKLDTFKKIQVILKMIIAEKEAKSALKSQTHMSREKEEFEHQFRDCVSQLTTNASVAVDWAALAKQWIQMQKTQPQVTSSPPVLPPVPPPSVTAPPILHPPPPGHGPMRPDDFPPEVPVNAPLMKAPMGPAGMPEQFSNDRPFENEPAAFIQKPVSNTYWNKSHWEASTANEVDDRLWPAPPPPPPIEPTSSLISGKETYDYGHMHDNPPLAMQSIDYNHMSEYSYNQPYPPETPYDQYWSQVNAAPPPIAPMFLKKEHSTPSSSSASTSLPVEEDTSQIDAAKRKQLPAWIREGLEKMEQERIKKLEKEKAEKEKAEKLAKAKLNSDTDLKEDVSNPVLVKSKFDSDSDVEEAEEDNVSINTKVEVRKRSPSPVEDFRTEEEKRQEYMLQLRRVLTEILLSVTNAEMYSIAEETLKKEKLKARQLASTASLTSVASGLRSLANYGTESEASEVEDDKDASDSDEELYRRIREKKKTFAIKQKKILAELERKEIEEQNEALKLKNDNKSVSLEQEDVDDDKESENIILKEEAEPTVTFISPTDVLEPPSTNVIPFIEEKVDTSAEVAVNSNSDKELKKSNNKDSHSSDSSSSSSESESESGEKHKKKSSKIASEKNSDKPKNYKRDKSPSRKHRHRSSDSDSSERHHKSRKSYDESSRKSSSYKKKKKYKRSDSSSSSGSSPRKKRYSSESKHNRSRSRRSHSPEDRKHRRSATPKSYRISSRDSHRSRDSYSHRHEKDKYLRRDKEEKYYDYKRSPSPHRRSKIPKKYRSSRSPSSESESSRKYKRTRAR